MGHRQSNFGRTVSKSKSIVIEAYKALSSGKSVTYCTLDTTEDTQNLFDEVLGENKVLIKGESEIKEIKLCQKNN